MERWKEWAIAVIVLVVVALNIAPFFATDKLPFLDPTTAHTPRMLALKESIQKFGDFFPLWNPYLNAGEPMNDGVFMGVDSLTGIISLFTSVYTALNLSMALSVVLGALFMYLLARYIFKDSLIAALCAILYSTTGYVITSLITSTVSQLMGYALTPLVLLFVMRAFKEKQWHLNAVIAGILLGLQMRLSPDFKITLLLSLAMAAFFVMQLVRPDFKKVLAKTAIIGLILIIVGGGLAADKILGLKETIDSSSRASLSYQESTLRTVLLKDFFEIGIQPLSPGLKVRWSATGDNKITVSNGRSGWFAMGIIATLLAAIGLYFNRKNRIVMFLLLTIVLSFLVITASPFFYLLWKFIPFWDSFRYLERAFSLWSLGVALAMGYGIQTVSAWVRSKKKTITHTQVVLGIAVLLALNILIFNRGPTPIYYCNVDTLLSENQVWSSLKDESGYFRVHEWETRGIDWPSDPYVVRNGLEHLYGYTGTWVPQYMGEYLVAAQQSPAKLWGIMNVKYVSATQPLNVSGLRLVKQFPAVTYNGECPPKEEARAYGPYLYENTEFLPRAQIVRHAVLVAGSDEAIRAATYQLMLSPNFNPARTAIIMASQAPVERNSDALSFADAVILTSKEAIDANSLPALQQVKQQGGVIIPDIVAGEQTATNEAVANALGSNKSGTPVPDSSIVRKNFGHFEIALPQTQKGLLVLSERYFYYNGWKAWADGKAVPILRANGFVSAIPLQGGEKSITLKYEPAGVGAGRTIFFLTASLVLGYFGYLGYRRYVHKH